jgi:DNA polymerase elongation subunit (family B)
MKKSKSKPKILFYDIETAPNTAYVWGKYEQNVLSYVKERELLSFAYKWQGSSEVICLTREGKSSDRSLVKKLHALLSKADVVVAHNGDEFDAKIAKARMIYHDLAPLRSLCSVDTKKAAKSYFKFNGNGLNDLGQFLKLGKKMTHQGFDLWLGCMANDPKAWKTMVRYNKQDVILLEKVYNRLLPWIENQPSVSILLRGDRSACPSCNSLKVKKEGIKVLHSSYRQRMACKACGYWFLLPLKLNKPGGK